MKIQGRSLRAESLWVAGTLTVLAAVAPGPLYLVAIACFGLPHVLWEMAWIRQSYGGLLPRPWWWLVGGILAVQAAARLGAWVHWCGPDAALGLDLLTLVLLAACAMLPRRSFASGSRHLLASALALALGAGMLLAGHRGAAFEVLLLMAVIHNFTPPILAPAAAELDGRPIRPLLAGLFLLPLLLALLPAAHGLFGVAPDPAWQPPEARWLQAHGPALMRGAFGALVLAQCLHYYSVLRLLPASLEAKWRPRRWRPLALVASAALTAYFAANFPDARQLYAVAAGVHSWLELPLLLLAVAGPARANAAQVRPSP